MVYSRIDCEDGTLIRGHFAFIDDAGQVLMEIQELDSVASAALNRLGGTARAVEAAA